MMKKRCLILLAAVLLFAALFSAAANAEGDPDRLVLTSLQYAGTPISLNKPYETWFMEGGDVYAIIVQQGQQAGISGARFTYTTATEAGKQIYTLDGGPYAGKKLTLDGSKASMTVKRGSADVLYTFDAYTTKSLFAASVTGAQAGSYIDYTFDAVNGHGNLTFRYDIFNSDSELVESGSTTGKSLHYKPNANGTYTLYLTAMDSDMDISEYIYTSTVYEDHPALEIENGIVKSYKGTGTSVVVPSEFHGSAVTGIAANAFANARGLEKIELPDSIAIDSRAFTSCNAKLFCALGSETARTLSFDLRRPFYDKETDNDGEFALQYMKINGYVDGDGNLVELLVLNKYTGTKADVAIPDYVDYIYNNAFAGSTVKTLEIPNSVIGIGTNAFNSCRQLNNVQVGTGLTSIGQNAFYNCVALTKLDLTDSKNIREIGTNAFYNCPADAHIYCDPNTGVTWRTVSSLPHNFFYENNNLTMELRQDAAKGLTLYKCFGNGAQSVLEIPSNVEYIAPNAFEGNKGLTEITTAAASRLREIGNNAFDGCTNLTNVDLLEATSLLTIGNYAFNGCEKLTDVTLPISLTSIGNFAFSGCKAPTDLSSLSNLSSIGASAFYNCKVDAVKLPNNITSIGGNAFTGGPKKVICGRDTRTAHSVSAMPYTFYDVQNEKLGLRWVVLDGVEKLALFEYDDSADPVEATVPDYVKAVDKDAFSKLKSTLETVEFESSLDEISTGTFDGCEKLESITLVPETGLAAGAIQNCIVLSKVLGLDDLSVFDTNFDNCPKLLLDLPYDSLRLALDVDFAKTAKLPFTDSLTDVEYSNGKVAQFDGTSKVVTAHEVGTTTITLYAAGKLGQVEVTVLSGLNGMTLPANLTIIEDEAFEGGSAQYVVLPAGTSSIGKRAFADNTGLLLIKIPKGAALDPTALAGSTSVVAVLDSDDNTNIGICEEKGISYQFLAG